jgi:hypothetical protein
MYLVAKVVTAYYATAVAVSLYVDHMAGNLNVLETLQFRWIALPLYALDFIF